MEGSEESFEGSEGGRSRWGDNERPDRRGLACRSGHADFFHGPQGIALRL